MSSLQYREKILQAKFMSAEDVRETKKLIKETIEMMKYQPKIKLYQVSKYQAELEYKLMQAWKDKQEKIRHFNRKHQLESLDHANILYKKIIKQAKNQENKFIRKEKAIGPKLEPLPYIKKIRNSLNKSMEIRTPTPQRILTPEETYVTKKLRFELVDSRKSSIVKEPKTFFTNIRAKV
jgi:hypothetical protein